MEGFSGSMAIPWQKTLLVGVMVTLAGVMLVQTPGGSTGLAIACVAAKAARPARTIVFLQ